MLSTAASDVTILHTAACIFTFAALVISLLLLRRRRTDGSARVPSALLLGIGIFTALLTTLVFLIDVILVAVVRQRLNNASDGRLTLNWGNAVCYPHLVFLPDLFPHTLVQVWMSLGATIALWAANAANVSNVFALRRKSRSVIRSLTYQDHINDQIHIVKTLHSIVGMPIRPR